jgi:hypothetical protein
MLISIVDVLANHVCGIEIVSIAQGEDENTCVSPLAS